MSKKITHLDFFVCRCWAIVDRLHCSSTELKNGNFRSYIDERPTSEEEFIKDSSRIIIIIIIQRTLQLDKTTQRHRHRC